MSKTRHLLWNGVGGASLVPSETLEILLSGEAAAQVREALASGEYGSASDVVADALHSWSQHREEEPASHLKEAWEEALRDDSPGLAPGPVFAEVRARLAARRNQVNEA